MRKHSVLLQGAIIALLLVVSSSFAVLDTIVLQHGLNGYYGASDRHSRSSSNGLENHLLIGCC